MDRIQFNLLFSYWWTCEFYSQFGAIMNKPVVSIPVGLPWWLSGKESVPMQETWVQYLGWDDLLEKETATHSSILTWEIPWTEDPGGLVHGVARVTWLSYQTTTKHSSKVFFVSIWCWSWNSNTMATSCEELTHWKRPWCWEGLGAGGEGDNRGWDGWMASLTRCTGVWVNSGSWL